MKNTKIWIPFIFGILSLFIVGFFTQGFNFPDPFMTEIVFNYPQIAVPRNDGGIFIIDTAFRRVLGTDALGSIDVIINGGNKSEGRFFYAHDLATDERKNLFVLNYVHDDYGMYLTREEILHYDYTGKLQSILVQRHYDELLPTRVQRGEIWGLRSDGTWLYWLVLTEEGLEAFRISIERQVLERLGKILIPDIHRNAADIDWIDQNQLVVTLKDGTFRRADLQRKSLSRPFYTSQGFPLDVPWEVAWTGSGFAYVNLVGKQIRYIPENSPGVRTILNPQILFDQGYPADPYYYYRITANSEGLLLTTNDEAVIVFDVRGRILAYRTSGTLTMQTIGVSYGIWILLFLGIILVLISIRRFYVQVMKRKISILLKQILVLIPVMIFAIVVITSVIANSFLERSMVQEELTIAGLTQAIGRSINGDLLMEVKQLNDYNSPSYNELRTILHESINDNRDPWNRSYYFALYKVIDDVLYGFMYQNDRIGLFFPFSWFDESQGVYRLAHQGQIATERISDVSGEWLYGVGPIQNSDGEIVGLLEIGTDLFNLNQSNRSLYLQTMRLMALISFIIIFLIVVMSFIILKSIRSLKKGVGQISQGNWDYQIMVKSNDEMSDLSQSFNLMSQSIGQYLQEIKKLNSSYRRFFPEQFLTYLDIPSLTDARLGDQVLKTMTVLFSDIRSFTDISERMSPKENFDFLNQYLNIAGPIIRKNNGFIDKYMGDAIMALFPNRPDDAIAASSQLHGALIDLNKEQVQRGLPEIRIGTGIHTGPLMLGILGESERMQGTVISDSVNLSARLETLTKQLGTSTLISEETLVALSYPDMISTRYLGKIRVKGKQNALKIYEVLEGLPVDQRERKIQLKPRLNAVLTAYESGNVAELEKRLAAYPLGADQEPIIGIIREIMKGWKEKGVPYPWDGSITFDSK